MSTTIFGTHDGRDVRAARIRSGAIEAEVIERGAAIRDMQVEVAGRPRRVVLGLKTLEDYRRYSPHMGAIAGRVANRTRNARVPVDGREWQLDANQDARHQLHGGANGFGIQNWTIIHADATSIVLALHDPAGSNGYPGAVDTICRYEITGDHTLRIAITATCDAATPINLATHSYFNLSGDPDIRDHHLTIDGRFYTPLDGELITKGEIIAVAGTSYDMTAGRRIRDAGTTFNLNYLLDFPGPDGLARAGRLESPGRDLALEVWTSEPGVQVYDADLTRVPVQGLHDWTYGAFCGLCMEPQRTPNAPNIRHFGDAILRPGQVYRQTTEYRFFP